MKKIKVPVLKIVPMLAVIFFCAPPSLKAQTRVNYRKVTNLNGIWKIAKTDLLAQLPSSFESEVPVPGLVDMASPAIDSQDTAYNNSVYWYKKSFRLNEPDAGNVYLKINKAKYHTRVYLNGRFVDENICNFTPSLFDVKPFLKWAGEENELIIAIGCKNNLPDTVIHGFDFEKTKYIPGIYDDVKLIVTGYPYIFNVQTAPDIKNQQLRVVAEIKTSKGDANLGVSYVIRETASKKVIAKGSAQRKEEGKANLQKVDFTVNLKGCRLWTPETPFLYDLELSTSGDDARTRFGMRTFEASKDSGVFLLNGKPYYMRGTNVCIFRFFEDPDRNNLPWDTKWVTKLHNRFKEMHWNSIRYCIGFPPERWYEIADSLGFLIQDEYPIWTSGKGGFEKLLKGMTSKQVAAEYCQWMRERWNHPCVVVWDAQNESVNDTTGQAIQMVRNLDLSTRPWDNGWAAPVSENDVIESHPYFFTKYRNNLPGKEGYLKELMGQIRVPGNDPNSHSPHSDGKRYTNPVILNEYGWIWLNRNGTTTTLTDGVYEHVFPEYNTPEERLEVYAKNLGILTEYWRAHRKAGAVMHFCGLGYSRPEKPRGQTSDNFTDIDKLTYEPHFYKYVKPAFAPIGIMIEFWEKNARPGQQLTVPVHIVNDTYEKVENTVQLNLLSGGKVIVQKSVPFTLEELQKKIIETDLLVPEVKGAVQMEATILYQGETIQSMREFVVE